LFGYYPTCWHRLPNVPPMCPSSDCLGPPNRLFEAPGLEGMGMNVGSQTQTAQLERPRTGGFVMPASAAFDPNPLPGASNEGALQELSGIVSRGFSKGRDEPPQQGLDIQPPPAAFDSFTAQSATNEGPLQELAGIAARRLPKVRDEAPQTPEPNTVRTASNEGPLQEMAGIAGRLLPRGRDGAMQTHEPNTVQTAPNEGPLQELAGMFSRRPPRVREEVPAPDAPPQPYQEMLPGARAACRPCF
jgi:hypothetical protein